MGWNILVQAGSYTSNNFSVSPLNPVTGQPQSTYYDLTVKPNEEKDIKVRIFNSSNSEIKVNVNANDASTNSNGVISYTGEEEKDSSLTIPFSTVASLEKSQVTIPKNSSTDVTIHLKIPNQEFSGIILGGIRVTGAPNQTKTKETPAVRANVAYSVAVVLKENQQLVDPSIHLLGVKKETRDYRNYISAELQNSAPRLVKKFETQASVYRKGSSQVLYQAKKSEMEVAPNSKFNFGISLENHSFKPGTYTMKVSGNADGKKYSFVKDFKITSKEAKTYNENSVYTDDSNSSSLILIILISVISFLSLLLLGYLILSHKKVRKVNRENEKNN